MFAVSVPLAMEITRVPESRPLGDSGRPEDLAPPRDGAVGHTPTLGAQALPESQRLSWPQGGEGEVTVCAGWRGLLGPPGTLTVGWTLRFPWTVPELT